MPARPASTAPRPRLLIVDDDESTRLLLARLLSKDMMIEAQPVGTCEQALRLGEELRVRRDPPRPADARHRG